MFKRLITIKMLREENFRLKEEVDCSRNSEAHMRLYTKHLEAELTELRKKVRELNPTITNVIQVHPDTIKLLQGIINLSDTTPD